MKQISIPTYASYSRDMTIVDAVDCELVSLLCSIWQPESVAIDLLFLGDYPSNPIIPCPSPFLTGNPGIHFMRAL